MNIKLIGVSLSKKRRMLSHRQNSLLENKIKMFI